MPKPTSSSTSTAQPADRTTDQVIEALRRHLSPQPEERRHERPRTVQVDLAGRGYDIVIGPGLIDRVGDLAKLLPAPRVIIVSDETVAPLYGDRLALLQEGRLEAQTFPCPPARTARSSTSSAS